MRLANKTVPWWNEQLTDMRKKVAQAKKELLRARRLQLVELIDNYAETYRELRKSHVSKIKKCKRETWQNFVNKEGNKDPWSIVYKIVREKFQKSSFWMALRLPNGQLGALALPLRLYSTNVYQQQTLAHIAKKAQQRTKSYEITKTQT